MLSNKNVKEIVISGAGLVGSLLSIFLARRNYKVTILEQRSDMRKSSAEVGKSINLALSNRGWKPLEEIGITDRVRKMIIPMKGRMMHDSDGILTFQPYGLEGQAINSVSRAGLNMLLMDKAEETGVNILFNHRCLDVDINNSNLLVESQGNQSEFKGDIIIGADGAFSAIRAALQITDRFTYSQHYIEHGYKELSVPPGNEGKFQLENNCLHIWPRGNFMLIALPNKDGSFTCTLFFPFEGNPSFSSLKNDNDVKIFFKTTFPDAFPLLSNLIEEFNINPTSSLVTVKCYPWVKKNIMLIGDAAHAVVPFFGQGMNAGFEDCRILNKMIDDYQGNWSLILKKYQESRKPDADAISDLALRNFIIMRDLVADEKFLLRKEIEAKLHELYPTRWIPLYSMVTFNENIPYSKASSLGKLQEKVMNEVMNYPDIENTWKGLDYEVLIIKYELLIQNDQK